MPIFQDQKGKNISNFQKMIDEKKNTIRKYYDEIGHLYYGQYKDVNVDMTKDINARCESISNLYIEIEDLNVKILRERGLKKCAVCGTENNLSNAFCFKCGARFDDADAIPADVIAPPNASATPSRKDNKVLPAEAAPVPAETGDIIEAAKAKDTTAEDNKEE
ncbi:MAG: zinc ribbon domain-containing protein [Clostridiales bacterium]|nr:zinc ribbon domain-containing protein [Clostridiales bacterium]